MIKHTYGSEYHITVRRIEPSDEHMLSGFDCGNGSINEFLKTNSIGSDRDVTYIFLDEENNTVIGFCSLCCSGITINAETRIDGKFTTIMPAVEIDFFAVDERYRSIKYDEKSTRYETLSAALFAMMLKHIETISNEYVGATHICLYAVPKAVHFYERLNFKKFEPYMHRDNAPFIDGCELMYYVLHNEDEK